MSRHSHLNPSSQQARWSARSPQPLAIHCMQTTKAVATPPKCASHHALTGVAAHVPAVPVDGQAGVHVGPVAGQVVVQGQLARGVRGEEYRGRG